MSEGPWWARSPIVVLPLCAAAFGLVLVPFLISSADHAAQFYGSFVAALVAALAVVSVAAFNAKLARQQRQEIRREEMLDGALGLYFAMHALAGNFFYLKTVIDGWLELKPVPEITVAELRKGIAHAGKTIRDYFEIAARIDAPLGGDLCEALYLTVDAIEDIKSQMIDDGYIYTLEQLKKRRDLCCYYENLLRFRRAQLGEFLNESKVIRELQKIDRVSLLLGLPKLAV